MGLVLCSATVDHPKIRVDLVVVDVDASEVAVATTVAGGLVALAPVEEPTVVDDDEIARGERVAELEPGIGGQLGEAAEGARGPWNVLVGHVGEAPDRVEGPDGQAAMVVERSAVLTGQRIMSDPW